MIDENRIAELRALIGANFEDSLELDRNDAEALLDLAAFALSRAASVLREREGGAIVDDPETDCTDAAHPAWWRGNDQGVASLCQIINDLLDGKDNGAGVARDPWESTRRRLLALLSAPIGEDLVRMLKAHDLAVHIVDALNGYTVDFASDKEAHRREYAVATSVIVGEFGDLANAKDRAGDFWVSRAARISRTSEKS